jgi:hypothetical protein
MDEVDRGPCFVICVDMWGSSLCWPEIHEPWTLPEVQQHNAFVDKAFAEATEGLAPGLAFRGGSPSDGRLYLIPSAGPAVQLICRLLGALAPNCNSPVYLDGHMRPITTSVGLAFGPVVEVSDGVGSGKEFRGRPVDHAARLAVVAAEGQVLAHKEVYERLRDALEACGLASDTRPQVVRLPGAEPSWDWPLVQVHRLRLEDKASPPLRNNQAATEQLLRGRRILQNALDEFQGQLRASRGTWSLVEGDPRVHDRGELFRLINAVERLIEPVTDCLIYFPETPDTQMRGGVQRKNLLEELVRAPAFEDLLDDLRGESRELSAADLDKLKGLENGAAKNRKEAADWLLSHRDKTHNALIYLQDQFDNVVKRPDWLDKVPKILGKVPEATEPSGV